MMDAGFTLTTNILESGVKRPVQKVESLAGKIQEKNDGEENNCRRCALDSRAV